MEPAPLTRWLRDWFQPLHARLARACHRSAEPRALRWL